MNLESFYSTKLDSDLFTIEWSGIKSYEEQFDYFFNILRNEK